MSLARSGSVLVAGWNDGGQCEKLLRRFAGQPVDEISLSGFGYSHDGGATWIDGGVLDAPEGAHLFGDPVIAPGPDGSFYYATLVRKPNLLIGVTKSIDGGMSWSDPVIASHGLDANLDQDKPWIAVDGTESEFRGNVYVAWTELTSATDWRILFSRSADGGGTFSPPIELSQPPMEGLCPSPSVTREGSGSMWPSGPTGRSTLPGSNQPGYVWFTSSIDGGLSFEPPRLVAQLHAIGRHAGLNHCVPQRTPGLETSPPRLRIAAPPRVLHGDILIGTSSADVLCGLGGGDILRGLGGDDLILGGSGRDRLSGGSGVDVCVGGRGRDRIRLCETRRFGTVGASRRA